MSVVRFSDASLNVPIDARRVINLTNTMPSLTITEAQEWINTFLLNSQNRLLTNLRNFYLLTNDILHQNNAAASNSSSMWTTLRSIRIDSIAPTPATLRVFFEYRCATTTTANSEFRVLRDTLQIGAVIPTLQTLWQQATIDVSDCALNTVIHIQSRHTTAAVPAEIQNFRILGQQHVILTLAEAINRRSAGAIFAFTNTL